MCVVLVLVCLFRLPVPRGSRVFYLFLWARWQATNPCGLCADKQKRKKEEKKGEIYSIYFPPSCSLKNYTPPWKKKVKESSGLALHFEEQKRTNLRVWLFQWWYAREICHCRQVGDPLTQRERKKKIIKIYETLGSAFFFKKKRRGT